MSEPEKLIQLGLSGLHPRDEQHETTNDDEIAWTNYHGRILRTYERFKEAHGLRTCIHK